MKLFLSYLIFASCLFLSNSALSGPIDSNKATKEEELLNSAKAYMESKVFNEAEKAYLAVLKINDKSIPAYIGLAQIKFNVGNKLAAQRQFDMAFKINEDNAALHTAYARFLMANKDIEGAKKHLNLALKINPDLPQANVELAVIKLSRENDAQTAVALYEKALEQSPKDIAYLYGLSHAQKQAGKLNEAITTLDKIIAINKELSLPYKLKSLHFRQQRNYPQAIANHKLSLQNNPTAAVNEHLALGELYLESSQYDEALVVYQGILREFGESAVTRTKLGYTKHMQGNLSEAQNHYEKAIEIDDSFPDPYNNLAYIVKIDSLEQAIEYSNTAVSLAPNNPFFLDTLGGLYIESKNYREAKIHLEKAVKIMPNYKDALDKLNIVNSALK